MSTRARSVRKVTVADYVVVVIAAIVFLAEIALLGIYLNALFINVSDGQSVYPDTFLYLLAVIIVGLIASASVIARSLSVRKTWTARWVPVAGILARFGLVVLGFFLARVGWDGASAGLFVSFYLVPSTFLLIVVSMTSYARQDRVVA